MGEIREEPELTEEDDLKKEYEKEKEEEVEEEDERVEELEVTGEVVMEEKEEKKDDTDDNDDVLKRFIFLYERSRDAESMKKFFHQMGATDLRKVQQYMRSEEERKKKKPILHSL